MLLLAVAARYGYHRDELYFLAASRHLALGYVDQPPISVLVAWLDRVAFGSSLFWLRVIPALLVGLIVVMTAAIAREFEASRFAQGFAALCAAGGAFLTVGHLEGPTVYDIAVWATTSWLIIRILRTGNERLWLAVGAVVGVGMEAKQTIPLLFLGLAVGIIMNRQAAIFRSRWLWGGVAIALVGVAPNIAWQISNDWPTATMNAHLRAEHSGLGAALKYPFIMVVVFGLAVAPVLLAGWWALWQQSRLRPYRAFAVAFVIGFVLLWVVIPDRFYYLFGIYPVLLAAGAIVTEQVADGARGFFRAAAAPPLALAIAPVGDRPRCRRRGRVPACAPARASGVCGRVGEPPERQLQPRRGDRLARLHARGRRGLELVAARNARNHGDRDVELWRGRRATAVRRPLRPARGLQRAQRVLESGDRRAPISAPRSQSGWINRA